MRSQLALDDDQDRLWQFPQQLEPGELIRREMWRTRSSTDTYECEIVVERDVATARDRGAFRPELAEPRWLRDTQNCGRERGHGSRGIAERERELVGTDAREPGERVARICAWRRRKSRGRPPREPHVDPVRRARGQRRPRPRGQWGEHVLDLRRVDRAQADRHRRTYDGHDIEAPPLAGAGIERGELRVGLARYVAERPAEASEHTRGLASQPLGGDGERFPDHSYFSLISCVPVSARRRRRCGLSL